MLIPAGGGLGGINHGIIMFGPTQKTRLRKNGYPHCGRPPNLPLAEITMKLGAQQRRMWLPRLMRRGKVAPGWFLQPSNTVSFIYFVVDDWRNGAMRPAQPV